jgi:diguanylate cyclase (GGDEF)-like protein
MSTAQHASPSLRATDPQRGALRGALRGARAYWEMQKRCAIIAASVNVAMLIVFQIAGLDALALFSIGSILAYALAWLCLQRRRNRLAIGLMCAETMIHAGFGFVLAGPESGSHYYLLLFFPALFLGSSPRKAMLPAAAVLAVYVALDAWVYAFGPLVQVSPFNQALMRHFNSAIIIGMLSYLAIYYRKRVVRSEHQLRTWAGSDPLTGLANRRHMDATIRALDADQRGAGLAVVMADIDHFKSINDRFGHEGGDMVLRRVAEVVQACIRDTDHVARWGGEEFLILLSASPDGQAVETAERIRRAVEDIRFDDLARDGAPLRVSLTLGVAQRRGREALQATIRKADECLYAGKRQGRNRVCRHAGDQAWGVARSG